METRFPLHRPDLWQDAAESPIAASSAVGVRYSRGRLGLPRSFRLAWKWSADSRRRIARRCTAIRS